MNTHVKGLLKARLEARRLLAEYERRKQIGELMSLDDEKSMADLRTIARERAITLDLSTRPNIDWDEDE
jgi:hypothetical protein